MDQWFPHQVSPDIQYHVLLSNSPKLINILFLKVSLFTSNPNLGCAIWLPASMMAISMLLGLLRNKVNMILRLGQYNADAGNARSMVGEGNSISSRWTGWKRAKWAKPVWAYLKYSEKIMTRHADLVISDNPGIESCNRVSWFERPITMERTCLRLA